MTAPADRPAAMKVYVATNGRRYGDDWPAHVVIVAPDATIAATLARAAFAAEREAAVSGYATDMRARDDYAANTSAFEERIRRYSEPWPGFTDVDPADVEEVISDASTPGTSRVR